MSAALPSESAVETVLDALVDRYVTRFPHLEELYDPDWRSPCEIGDPYPGADGERRIAWRPRRRDADQAADDFAGLERALELTIHPSVKSYYARWWSGGLAAEAPRGPVSLLFLWNQQDVDRLTENLIGHALAKRRARSPFTVFFACTEADSELFLSIDNDSGRVLLEAPGQKPREVVAESLAEFLESLSPASRPGPVGL